MSGTPNGGAPALDSLSPAADEPLAETLQLAMVHGIGPRLRSALLARFGRSAAVLRAGATALQATPGVGRRLSEAIVAAGRSSDEVRRMLEVCEQHGIRVLTEASREYPRLLHEIPDPPPVLFVRGSLVPQDALSVAIVGSRAATNYGRRHAKRLARELAFAGVTVVSGLARGVDGAAHRGALEAGGRTIGVLGSGLLHIYPPEHRDLAEKVVANGALISEQPPYRAAKSGAFPQRNRVITGLSVGVLVVEAGARSGALISARHAVEQNREVFALPGRVDSGASRGCHGLLRDGARLVENADDILEELGPLVERRPERGMGESCATRPN